MINEPNSSLGLSRRLLTLARIQVTLEHPERIPGTGPLIVVSNHRSLLDVPLLIATLGRPIRYACHYFMGQVPGVKQGVAAMGCFPLDPPGQRPRDFFRQGTDLLQAGQAVGIFPEGAEPMVAPLPVDQVGNFYRGFAHLALGVPVDNVMILPVAIATLQATTLPVAPFKLFHWLAPSEPRFNRPGWHPAVVYHRVRVIVGHPLVVPRPQAGDQSTRHLAQALTQSCHGTISQLLQPSNLIRLPTK